MGLAWLCLVMLPELSGLSLVDVGWFGLDLLSWVGFFWVELRLDDLSWVGLVCYLSKLSCIFSVV